MANNIESADISKLIGDIESTFLVKRPQNKTGQPPTAREADLVAVIRAIFKFNLDYKERIEKCESKIHQLEGTISSLTESNKTKDHEISQLKSQLSNERAVLPIPSSSSPSVDVINAVASDIEERRSREKNLVLFGVAEMSGEDPKSLDRKFADDLLKRVGSGPIKIKNVHRLKLKQPSTNPPPIIVSLTNKSDRDSVLKLAKTLKDESEDSKFYKVYIGPDLTFAQRVKQKQIRDERKAKLLMNSSATKKTNNTNDENDEPNIASSASGAVGN